MYYLKQLLTLTVVCCAYLNVNAQCSVTKKNVDGGIGYETKFEAIYRNEDLENGILGVHYKMTAVESKQGYRLQAVIMVSNKRPKEPIIPRNLQIVLQGNKTIHLDASTHDMKQLTIGTTSNICSFNVTPEQLKELMSKNTESITISDNRTNQRLRMTPYSGLVKEQATCLDKEMR